MNYTQSFTFVVRQPNWVKKIAILIGLVFVPIFGWLVIAGYIQAITRNVIRGNQPTLPDWTDFGRLLTDGLKILVVVIVWSIVPAVVDIFTDIIDVGILELADIVVQVVFSIFIIAATGVLASTGNIADGLGFSAVIARVRATPRPYVEAAIVTTVIAFVAVLVAIIPGLIAALLLALLFPLGFGVVFGIVLAILLYGLVGISAAHLTGQAHRLAEGTALPAAPRF